MADAAVHGHDHEDNRGFFTRWFMSTNHKDIGILYLLTGGLAGFVSVAFTVYMRLELMEPGVQYMCMEGARFTAAAVGDCTPNGHLWNVLITGHGILMMFFVVIPALVWRVWQLFHAFANWRARYGIPSNEQPILLDVCCRYNNGDTLSGDAGWKWASRLRCWVGTVPASFRK